MEFGKGLLINIRTGKVNHKINFKKYFSFKWD